jgi:hypothetical protein
MSAKRRDNKRVAKWLNVINRFRIGGTEVSSTADEINTLDGAAAAVEYTVGTEAANVINLGLQFQDANGVDVAVPVGCKFYLADDSVGLTPSATAPDGGIAIGTDGALIEWTANLSGLVVSESDGDVDIDLTESGVATWYFVTVLPNGKLDVSTAITFA